MCYIIAGRRAASVLWYQRRGRRQSGDLHPRLVWTVLRGPFELQKRCRSTGRPLLLSSLFASPPTLEKKKRPWHARAKRTAFKEPPPSQRFKQRPRGLRCSHRATRVAASFFSICILGAICVHVVERPRESRATASRRRLRIFVFFMADDGEAHSRLISRRRDVVESSNCCQSESILAPPFRLTDTICVLLS